MFMMEGVKQVRVSLMSQKADITYQPDLVSADDIVQRIINCGFGASLLEFAGGSQHGSVDLQASCLHLHVSDIL